MIDRRALVLRATVPAGVEAWPPPAEPEARLRALVEEVSRLDLEVETLSAALGEFATRSERYLAEPLAEVGAAEVLVSRLRGLESDLRSLLGALERGEPLPAGEPPARRRPRRRRRRPRGRGGDAAGPSSSSSSGLRLLDLAGAGAGAASEPAVALAEPADLVLKRLYRRLARLLHPDLAREGERERLGDLMVRANAAYARGDLGALTLLAETVGAAEPAGELDAEERRIYLERRLEALSAIARSLARERELLMRSDTHRLWEEAVRREREGGDYLEEARQELLEEAQLLYEEATDRLTRVDRVAADLSSAKSTAMTNILKSGPRGLERSFDPLRETAIVRQAAARLGRRRASPAARALAGTLEEAAHGAPWEVALTLLAFFAEEAGARPPAALASAEQWRECWDLVRGLWPGAPDLPRLLARLPDHLGLGARGQGEGVVAGPQLVTADLAEGVRAALDSPAVSAVARPVLLALGPRGSCGRCGPETSAQHLLRTRGLDEQHALVCRGCTAVLRSYWRYGEVEGLEALAPHAVRLGLAVERTVQLAGTAIGFQLLPREARALGAGDLVRRLIQLYFVPYQVPLPAEAVGLASGQTPLAPDAAVPPGELRFTLDASTGATVEELLELLRVRIERRFRP